MSRDHLLDIHQDVLNKLTDPNESGFYLIDAIPIIKEYQTIIDKPKVINFMNPSAPSDSDERIRELKIQYQSILHKYKLDSPLNITTEDVLSNCEECGSTGEQIIANDSVICSECCTEKHDDHNTFSYKDVNRINVTSKYNYNRATHFRDCIYQFQGKQNTTIPPEVYDGIYERIHRYKLCLEGDLPRNVKYERVTKKHIYLFLKEMDYTNYEDNNLIYHTITGRPLPDISYIEQDLIRDFDILNNLYKTEYIKNSKMKRKNFINTQYVLFQLLRRYDYPCEFDDFNVLKTIERKIFHDEICSKLFEKLEWNFTNIF